MTLLPDGQLVCGGAVPENCSLAVGNINKSDVLKTFSQAAEALLADKQDGILLFSCAARNLVLGFDALVELQAAQEKLEGRAFMLAYSGGEICPVRTAEGLLKNRFHNISLISCSFK
jgi:hypothetical protein